MNVLSKILDSLRTKTYEVTNSIGTWQVREHGDGYVECELFRTNALYTITTAKGSMYGISNNAILPIPVTLSKITSCDVNVASSSWEVLTSLMNVSPTQIEYRVLAPVSRNSRDDYKLIAKVCGYIGGGNS